MQYSKRSKREYKKMSMNLYYCDLNVVFWMWMMTGINDGTANAIPEIHREIQWNTLRSH